MDRLENSKFKIQNSKLVKPFFYLCLSVSICGQFFLLSCSNSNQNTNSQVAEQPAFEVPAPQINLLKPLEISNKPEDVALAKKIDELIEKSEFANARWGVFAVSLKDGRVWSRVTRRNFLLRLRCRKL